MNSMHMSKMAIDQCLTEFSTDVFETGISYVRSLKNRTIMRLKAALENVDSDSSTSVRDRRRQLADWSRDKSITGQQMVCFACWNVVEH